jgi:hypothetical protein
MPSINRKSFFRQFRHVPHVTTLKYNSREKCVVEDGVFVKVGRLPGRFIPRPGRYLKEEAIEQARPGFFSREETG